MMIMVKSENGKASIVGVNDAAQDMQEDVRASHAAATQQQWHSVFRETPPPGIPPIRIPGAELVLDDGDPREPPAKKVIRLNESQLAELRLQLQYYLDQGFLRPSSSAYASPVFFVPKPHTLPVKWRMAVDY